MSDKSKIKKLKKQVVKDLQLIDVQAYKLSNTDNRLNSYAYELIDNPNAHNLYELLALLRFFKFLDKYIFKPVEVKRFIVFYEGLKFDGTKGMTSYKLTPVQVFQFANIMGFYETEEKRLTREALLFVPRKFSKTTSVSSLAIYDLLFGDYNAEAYVAANSYTQAQICFTKIKDTLKVLDPRFRHFKVNREQIYNLRRGRNSFARCLASNADKLDGLNASLVILDEYAQADSAELKNVLTSSMGARLNPLTVVITTASDKLDGPFVELLNSYKAILRGDLENDSVFAHIFEPDVGDREGDPRTWAKVQPHIGITVQPDFYAQEWANAQLTTDDLQTFRTKLLNIFSTNTTKAWITREEVEKLRTTIDITSFNKPPLTMVSVDLSVCDDFSAVTYMMYFEGKARFHSITEYYIPESLLTTHPNRELYQRWVDDGYLKTCPGEVVDYDMIARDIMSNGKHLLIPKIGYDSYRSLEFVNMMKALNRTNSKALQPVSQTYGTFTSPVETMEYAVRTKGITFDNNPITWYCFGNAVMDEDRNENRKPLKRSQNEKIDGVITNLMCMYLFNNYKR